MEDMQEGDALIESLIVFLSHTLHSGTRKIIAHIYRIKI